VSGPGDAPVDAAAPVPADAAADEGHRAAGLSRRPAGGGRGGGPASGPLSLADLEQFAAEKLSAGALAYYSGAACDEVTLADNLAAFRRWRVRPRVMVDIKARDTSVTVLGRRWPAPVMVAPLALHRLADPEGEVAVARAAAARNLTMCLSTVGSATIEEVAAACGTGPRWFQLYPLADRGKTRELLDRAVAAGYEAIVFTADCPILGRRERDRRDGFVLPPGVGYPNLASDGDTYARDELATSYTWADLEWVANAAGLPVIAKGVLDPADSILAFEHGASGVVVSNHGGRQLDLSIAALDALPDVVAAVDGRGPVLFDSGIRRGTDVLIALALGARAVMLGRPILWALAWDGEAGVGWAFDQLLAEFDLALALAGVPRAADLSTRILIRAR
jgi:4-hydroxymandelate oxidase